MIMIAPLFFIMYNGLPGGTFPSAHHIYLACIRCTLKTLFIICSLSRQCWRALSVVTVWCKSSVGFHAFCMGGAGSSRFTNGVPGHLHSAAPSYCTLLFFMTIVAPWEQANNAAMFAEVHCPFPLLPWHA